MKYSADRIEYKVAHRIILKEGDTLYLRNKTYSVVNIIGKGGFGSVYKVSEENGKNNSLFAVKLLDLYKVQPDDIERLKQRFINEFKVGRLDSPYLVKYYDTGSLKGNPYILMEYCGGGNLFDELKIIKSESQVLNAAIDIASGLKALHSMGIVHRDIKPENILKSDDGRYKISDFGISTRLKDRMTQVNFLGKVKYNEVFGSVMYSPPEQLNSKSYYKKTSPMMDIYSFGVLLYNLTHKGKDPFGGEVAYQRDSSRYLKNKTEGILSRPIEIQTGFSRIWYFIIKKCIEPKPEDRYQSIEDVIQKLSYIHKSTPDNDSIGLKHKVKLHIEHSESKKSIAFPLDISHDSGEISMVIGRDTKVADINDIPVKLGLKDDFLISKRHATLRYKSNRFFITDGHQMDNGHPVSNWTGSLNGTMVNKKKILPGDWVEIKEDDLAEIGNYTMKLIVNYDSI